MRLCGTETLSNLVLVTSQVIRGNTAPDLSDIKFSYICIWLQSEQWITIKPKRITWDENNESICFPSFTYIFD